MEGFISLLLNRSNFKFMVVDLSNQILKALCTIKFSSILAISVQTIHLKSITILADLNAW